MIRYGSVLLWILCSAPAHSEDFSSAVEAWLKKSKVEQKEFPRSNHALTRAEADRAAEIVWDVYRRLESNRAAKVLDQKFIEVDGKKMRFEYRVFGNRPEGGRSLYISMHGGGGAPTHVNDQQWRNQIGLYELNEGIYVAPRAPTDTWNLWHQAHIDIMFTELIRVMVTAEGVNPDRVYLMGYSAGGDGVYQVAPRMADRFAAAAMMAGHPNESSPLGLRNLPFTIHVGELDAGYKRNVVAREWGARLATLQKKDPGGYVHYTKIHKGRGHWMNREDAEAVPWMAKHTRNRYPDRVVWKQDDVVHQSFYWLLAEDPNLLKRAESRASITGQSIRVESDYPSLTFLLNDLMVDLDRPLKITNGARVLFEGRVPRTVGHLLSSLQERGDEAFLFPARVKVQLGGVHND